MIVVVEDSEADAFMAQESLLETKLLNSLTICPTVEQAWAVIAAEPPPDLMLIDVRLQGRDRGFEVLEAAVARGIPVVMYSGIALPEWVAESRRLGAAAFMEKPFTAIKLLMLVAEIGGLEIALVKVQPSM